MIVTAKDVNSFPLYTSRRSLQFLATRAAVSVTLSMLASVGISIAFQLPLLFCLAIGTVIACALVWAQLEKLKKNEISARILLGGKLFVYLPQMRYGESARFEVSITEQDLSGVAAMISFDFPGYGLAMRSPIMEIQKGRRPDHDHAPPSQILMEGQILFVV